MTLDYRTTVFLPRTDFPMKAGLPEKEPRILAKWQAEDVYGQLRAARAGRETFILHDGPPYANGDIHIGHAMQKVLKDLVVRTQSLAGKDAPFVPGWDCHGLPIEWKVEEAYRKGKRNKDEVPVAEFRAECRAYAGRWVDVQREQFKRLGIGGAWDRPYLTMDFSSEAAIVGELLKFAESGQLYRGAKPVMWSPVEKTALAEAEVEYADVVSTQIDVGFEIIAAPNVPELVGAFAVVWTTTPWTIPVNQAIAYGAEIEYVCACFRAKSLAALVEPGARGAPLPPPRYLVMAAALVRAFADRMDWNYTGVIWEGKGSDLAGANARHPMNQFGGFFAKPRPFLAGDFVTTEQGTGLVHMAPDHGEDDFILCKANGIEPVFAVEGDGRYRGDWLWLGGEGSVINPKFNSPEGPICSDLRGVGGLLAASADYSHSYPHSWRSKAKVIFRATPQWFIPMDVALSMGAGGAGEGLAAAERTPTRAAPRGASLASPLEGEETGLRASSLVSLPEGQERSLRAVALGAIAATRFVPEKGRNRLGSMVAGRPDWVISRQRAWGVPITLFVDRWTGAYLCDPAVNARIVAAVAERGVDAWSEAAAQGLLGNDYSLADYERVTDILDVWFDSGCTHAFVLESGRWPELRWPADLYLEGSDQHRGWFQSSLLESCGTRGRAPYKAVLTHGMTLDAKGFKQSKSLGNTTDPAVLLRDYGADIIRLWTATSDTTEDHRIGDEILKGVADQYRKLRNTFRYLLGALDGFDEAELVAVAEMPEVERWVLHRLAAIDGELRAAVDDFDFSGYVTAISTFINNDLSAFVFDVRKDSLYCDAVGDLKRRAYRTVLDILFQALTRWLAPVLVFTCEEVWGTRFPDRGSVHLLEWPAVEAGWRDEALGERMARLRELRRAVTEAIEPLRKAKMLGSGLEAAVVINPDRDSDAALVESADFAELCIVSSIAVDTSALLPITNVDESTKASVTVAPTTNSKCQRCWRHLPDVAEDIGLCRRCNAVVNG